MWGIYLAHSLQITRPKGVLLFICRCHDVMSWIRESNNLDLHSFCICFLSKPVFQIVVLEKTLESPLDRKKIKPVNPKGNQP